MLTKGFLEINFSQKKLLTGLHKIKKRGQLS
jgi:hypothetical protein